MKKLAVFLLIPFFLLNGFVHELGKIPALFSHFDEHNNAEPGLGIREFIAMHYFGDDNDSTDNTRDESLPFKKPADPDGPEVLALPGFFFFRPVRRSFPVSERHYTAYNGKLIAAGPGLYLRPPIA